MRAAARPLRRFSPVRRSSTPSFVRTPSAELQAGRGRDKQQYGGPNETDLHALHERFAMRDERTEQRDGKRAAELAAGVQHAAGSPGPLGGHVADQQRGNRRNRESTPEPNWNRQ